MDLWTVPNLEDALSALTVRLSEDEVEQLEEYKGGHITKPELRRMLGYTSRYQLDGFLKAHGVDESSTLEEIEQQVEGLEQLGLWMQVVVADTTPVRYLAEIGHLDLLPRLFETIFIPSVVYEELQHPASPQILRDKPHPILVVTFGVRCLRAPFASDEQSRPKKTADQKCTLRLWSASRRAYDAAA